MLTLLKHTDSINMLSGRIQAGRRNPGEKAKKSPLPLVAFLCSPFSAGLIHVHSFMVGLFGQRSALAGAFSQFSTPFKPATKYCRKYYWRLSHFEKVIVMPHPNHTQKPTAAVSLFSVYWHRQLIASGLSNSVALRFKSYYPDCVVKFSGFVGGSL